MLLVELGVIDRWKKITKKAIAKLEGLTGLKFKSTYSRDKNDIIIDVNKLKEFKELKKQGYYSDDAKDKRKEKRLSELKTSMIEKVQSDYEKQILKHERELAINLELINKGFEISPRTGNIKGAIYYNHINELNFNWSTEKIKDSKIVDFANSLDKEIFKGLTISSDKKEICKI